MNTKAVIMTACFAVSLTMSNVVALASLACSGRSIHGQPDWPGDAQPFAPGVPALAGQNTHQSRQYRTDMTDERRAPLRIVTREGPLPREDE